MKSLLERIMEPRLEADASVLTWSIRRKVILGPYTHDFLVAPTPVISLCVELDGAAWHERTEEQGLRDRKRDRYLLSSWAIPTIRFLGKEVMRDPDAVVTEIICCAARMAHRREVVA